MFVEEGEYIGLARIHTEIEEAVTFFGGLADWRINLHTMWLTELRKLCAQALRRLT